MLQQDNHNIAFLEYFEKLAFEATSIPLSLFMHLLHQHYPTCKYFEGTLEIIQQFEIVGFKIGIGSTHRFLSVLSDSEFSLKCRRCRQNICHPGAIQDTLVIASYCMLVHLGLPEEKEVDTESYCHPMLYCMGEPTYRDKGKVKCCKYLQERLPQLAFCEALKLYRLCSCGESYHQPHEKVPKHYFKYASIGVFTIWGYQLFTDYFEQFSQKW